MELCLLFQIPAHWAVIQREDKLYQLQTLDYCCDKKKQPKIPKIYIQYF